MDDKAFDLMSDPEVMQAAAAFVGVVVRRAQENVARDPMLLLGLLGSHVAPKLTETLELEKPPVGSRAKNARINIDRSVLVATLREHGGVKRKAAAALGITVPTLNKYLKRRQR